MTAVTEPAYTYRALLLSVYDGDTIRCDIDIGFGIWLRNQSIRLFGIDAPEIRGEERPQGLMAKEYFLSLISPGDTFILQTIKDRTGKYGRWLGKLWIGMDDKSWMCLNDAMVSAGHATYKSY